MNSEEPANRHLPVDWLRQSLQAPARETVTIYLGRLAAEGTSVDSDHIREVTDQRPEAERLKDAATDHYDDARKWEKLALHALSDLEALGLDISLVPGVDDDVLHLLEQYQRDQSAYS